MELKSPEIDEVIPAVTLVQDFSPGVVQRFKSSRPSTSIPTPSRESCASRRRVASTRHRGRAARRGTNHRVAGSRRATTTRSSSSSGEPSEPGPGEPSRLILEVAHV